MVVIKRSQPVQQQRVLIISLVIAGVVLALAFLAWCAIITIQFYLPEKSPPIANDQLKFSFKNQPKSIVVDGPLSLGIGIHGVGETNRHIVVSDLRSSITTSLSDNGVQVEANLSDRILVEYRESAGRLVSFYQLEGNKKKVVAKIPDTIIEVKITLLRSGKRKGLGYQTFNSSSTQIDVRTFGPNATRSLLRRRLYFTTYSKALKFVQSVPMPELKS